MTDALPLLSGAHIQAANGTGIGRLAAVVVDRNGVLFGLTTYLIASDSAHDVLADGVKVGVLTPLMPCRDTVEPIEATLGVIRLNSGVALLNSIGRLTTPKPPLSPFDALNRRVQVIRAQGQPSFGTVVAAASAVRLHLSHTGEEQVFIDAIAIAPNDDGAMFAQEGDAGALLVASNGALVGVLIGAADGLFYAAPLDQAFAKNGLRLAMAADIPSAAPIRLNSPTMAVDQLVADFRKHAEASKSESRSLRIGMEAAGRLARHLSRDDDLHAVWSRFDVPIKLLGGGKVQDQSARYRIARAALLREWSRLRQSPRPTDEAKQIAEFRDSLGLDAGHWARAVKLIDEIRQHFSQIKFKETGESKISEIVIGYSGYHEERIITEILASLCILNQEGRILDKAPAPYKLGRTLASGFRPGMNVAQGGADVRMINRLAGAPHSNEVLSPRPVLQHFGYRAYARKLWLREISQAARTPPLVVAWIEQALNGQPDFSSATRPARCWLISRGEPQNYPLTEFSDLLEYIWRTARLLDDALGPVPGEHERPPDEVFQGFVAGHKDVLISGSIHDVLIDQWLSIGDDIQQLLTPADFQDLRMETGGRLGMNHLLFSSRIGRHPALVELFTDLYRETWAQLTARLSDSATRRGTLRYLSTFLAPEEPFAWSFAVDDAAILRLVTEEVRMVEDVQAPRLRLVQGGAS